MPPNQHDELDELIDKRWYKDKPKEDEEYKKITDEYKKAYSDYLNLRGRLNEYLCR